MDLFQALIAFLMQTAIALGTLAPPETVVIPGPDGVALRAALVRPVGAARGPAVIGLHGCDGPNPPRDGVWAAELATRGHIVLLLDSFGSRGAGPVCRQTNRAITASGLRRADAVAAARWLGAQPGVPGGGVVLMGWSNGASTVLAAARRRGEEKADLFRGFVAFYPGCQAALASREYAISAPMLLLIGENDDWTPAAPCRDLAARFPAQIQFMSYPGAWHGFDVLGRPVRELRGLAYTAKGNGVAHAGSDPAARADALVRVPAFFAGLHER